MAELSRSRARIRSNTASTPALLVNNTHRKPFVESSLTARSSAAAVTGVIRMAGARTARAPRACSIATSSAAWCRARVTITTRPCSDLA